MSFIWKRPKEYYLALLAEVARMNRSSEEKILRKGKITNMISRSIDYISQCYMEDIRIGDLAKACHISETHFSQGVYLLYAYESSGIY